MLLEACGGRWALFAASSQGHVSPAEAASPGPPGSVSLWVGGTGPSGPCSRCWCPSWLPSPLGPPARPSSHFVSVVTVPLPPFHVACPAAYPLKEQVCGPRAFHLPFLPWVLEGRIVQQPQLCGAEGAQEARQSCRNQAVPGSGPWEEQSVWPSLPIPGTLLCPPVPLCGWRGVSLPASHPGFHAFSLPQAVTGSSLQPEQRDWSAGHRQVNADGWGALGPRETGLRFL